jgi:putative ABC transport system permease protein
MEGFGELWRRVLFLFRRTRLEDELAEEMKLHLELRTAERAGEGAAPGEAADAARRQFGNVTHLRETGRDVWGWAWLDSLVQDVRYGGRALAANPGFTLTAVLSLALGIGANTAIFSIVNAVMLRSLPVADPHRLVELQADNGVFTNPIWEQVRDHQQALSGVLAFSGTRFDLARGGESRFATGMWVSGDFFRVLGVSAARGRLFTMDDDRHGGGKYGPVAVISHAFWQSHFAGDPDVVGKTILLDRHPFEIVGVTAPHFTGLEVDHGFQVAIPIGCEPIFHTDQSALDQRSWWWLRILGRLRPGATLEQSDAQMKALSPEVFRATVPPNWDPPDKARYLKWQFRLKPAATGFSETGSQYRDALFTLMAVVGLVLVIACANIANLLLARAAARSREISIRLAIGAGRRRVIRQLLTESLLLALLGAAGGLLFARWGSGALVRLLSTTQSRLELDVSLDTTVLAFTAGVAIFTAVLFGLAPAFRATRVSPEQALRENARGSVAGSSRFRLGKALVAAQVALSLVLLVGAGLFMGTIRNLLAVDAGFDRHHVLIVHAGSLEKVPKPQRTALFQTLLERLRRVPGVTDAASALLTPVSHMVWNDNIFPEGYQPKSHDDTLTYLNRVSPGYLRTIGTPLLMGRDFTDRDRIGSPKVIVISQSAARKFFGKSNPIGRTIGLEDADKPGARNLHEIIGVAKDIKYDDMKEETLLTAYLPTAQDEGPWPEVNFVFRSAGPAEALIPGIRAAVAETDRGISLEFRNFETQVDESLLQPRLVALLSSFFGALALLLATIGLYGVTSYAVLRRQGEIGLRMALGASQSSVISLVLRDVALMLALGTVAGLAASLAAGRLITSLLYGVRPADPATLAGAAALLGLATAIAGYIPALRASRLDPTAALREE